MSEEIPNVAMTSMPDYAAKASTQRALLQRIRSKIVAIDTLSARLQQKQCDSQILIQHSQQLDALHTQLCQLEQTLETDRQANAPIVDKSRASYQEDIMDKEQNARVTSEQAGLIDELALKLQEVEIKLASASLQNMHIIAQNTVKTHMLAGMTLGLLPAPLFDIAALTGTQVSLLRSLSRHYEVDFEERQGKVFATSLLGGSLPVLTVMGLSSVAKVVPGVGTVAGGIGMTTLAGAIIYATGQVFIRHFESGGTFKDFDAKHWRAFFKEQLQEGKTYTKNKLGKGKPPAPK